MVRLSCGAGSVAPATFFVSFEASELSGTSPGAVVHALCDEVSFFRICQNYAAH
jgi:hypothetical protein